MMSNLSCFQRVAIATLTVCSKALSMPKRLPNNVGHQDFDGNRTGPRLGRTHKLFDLDDEFILIIGYGQPIL